MANAIAVVAETGFGKSTAYGQIPELGIRGLAPEETILFNVKDKPLAYRGWRRLYKPPISQGGNYLATTDPAIMMQVMSHVNDSRPEIKNLVLDDFQYVMAEEFMFNALKTGYDKYNKLAKNAYDLINTGIKMRSDLNFIVLTHMDTDKEGTPKMKTIGKMLEEKVTLSGLFTVVLYGKESYDEKTKVVSKQFVTNYDGFYPAKSPVGMFTEKYIPNDLGFVVEQVNQYYNGE